MDGGCNNITTFFFCFFLNPSLRDQTITFGYWWPKCNYMNICRKKSKKSKTLWCKQSYCFPVPTTMRKKLPKNSLKCMVLQIVQNLTVFGFFLNFFLFNHPKTNTDRPIFYGWRLNFRHLTSWGVWNFFLLWAQENRKNACITKPQQSLKGTGS